MVARADNMFGCYSDSYSYRLWNLANIFNYSHAHFPPLSETGHDEKRTTPIPEENVHPAASPRNGRGRRSPVMPLGPGGPFKCLECGGAYPSRILLDKHALLHSSSTQSCNVCNKTFLNVYRLQRHMISHDESAALRKFKCNDCVKAFKFKHHLKEHLRIHSGEKPFECGSCRKKFSHSGSYSSHMTSKKCLVVNLKMGRIRPNNPALKLKRSSNQRKTSSLDSQTNNNIITPTNNNSFLPILPKYNEAAAALLASMTAREGAFPASTNPLAASGFNPLYLPPGLPLHHPASIAPYSLPASLSHILEHFATSQYMPRKSEFDMHSKLTHFHHNDHEDKIEEEDKKSSIGDENELVMDIEEEENIRVKEEKIEEPINGNDLRNTPPRLPSNHSNNGNLVGLNMILESVNASVTKHFIEANMHKLSPHSGSSCPSVTSPAPPMTIKSDPDEPTLQCNRCQKTFTHRAELAQHEQVLCGQLFRKHEGLAAQVAETLALNRIEAEMHASINSGISASEDEDYNKEMENKHSIEGERKVRVRTAISDEQQGILKEYYARNQRPNREEFKQIAQRLGLDNRVVQVWFQNNRARVRRMNHSNNQHVDPPMTEQPLDLSTKKSNHSTASSPPVSPNCYINTFHSDLGEEAVNLSQKSSRSPTPYQYSYQTSYLHSNCSSASDAQHSPSTNDSYRRDLFRLHNSLKSDIQEKAVLLPYSPDIAASPSQLTSHTESDICRASSCSPGSERRSWTEESRISQDGDGEESIMSKKNRVKSESKEPEGQFNCDQCDKTFVKQSSLARHKYEHSGQRPYKCVECPKAFKHKHHLTEHKRIHTGEQPFQCCKCLKKFKHSGSYSQHMNQRYSYCKPYRE